MRNQSFGFLGEYGRKACGLIRFNTRKLTRFRRGIWLSVSSRAMSIRTHFCVVQCYSQLGWPVIKGGKPIWNPDPHHGFVDAFLFSAIWHALGGKRGLDRPGLDVAVKALAGGELTSVTSSGRGTEKTG